MRRGVVFLIGLATLGTGIWLIASENSRNSLCNASSTHLLGISSSCQDVAWTYFAGFVIAGIGLVVLMFTRLMKRHELRYHARRESPTELSLRGVADPRETSIRKRRSKPQ